MKEVVMLDGEEKLFELEGNAFTESSNPVLKAIMGLVRIIGMILGHSLKTYIIITNQRVLRVDKETAFWVLPRNTAVTALTKKSIMEVGYEESIRWFFIKTLFFRFQSSTENTRIAYKGNVNDLNEMVTKVSAVIAA
ncbi:MAG: hypothetical protein ACI86H_002851 [bacterium]|jgi:hypothetical protein